MPQSFEATVELPADVALHARPAAEFVRTAMAFDADLLLAANGRSADAKSLLAVLALGATGGTELGLRAEGRDAGEAIDALTRRIAGLTE